jgi:hypothetical protein
MADDRKKYQNHKVETALLLKIIHNIWADEYNPKDWFTDDKGGEWHVDCPTNPYGDNFQDVDGDMEPYNPLTWVEDYQDVTYQLDNMEYFLLHEYLYIQYPHDSEHIRTLTFVHFAKLMDIDFSDVLDLVAMHPSKPSTTGLSKLQKELLGVNKKVFTDIIMDYIELLKEAGMPSINEDHIIAMKDKGMITIAEFWHIYGTMALLVNGGEFDHEQPHNNANEQAMIRFTSKISDDKTVLYPLLTYLYQEWANDKEWLKQDQEEEQNYSMFDQSEAEVQSELGYAGIMYAKRKLEPWRRRQEEEQYNLNIERQKDWQEFTESEQDDLNAFIKNKYYT